MYVFSSAGGVKLKYVGNNDRRQTTEKGKAWNVVTMLEMYSMLGSVS